MAAAVSTTPNLKPASQRDRQCRNPNRPPLLRSETTCENAVPQRRPKEVASRYMSTSSSSSSTSSSTASNNSAYLSARRSSTPIPTRTAIVSATNTETPLQRSSSSLRSHSAERRRPVSAAAKILISASKRNLSASFQGDSLSTPVGKRKPNQPLNSAKASVEKVRPAERNPWPARSRKVSSLNTMSTSIDSGSGMKKLIGRSGSVVRALRQSLGDRTDPDKSEEDNSASVNVRILSISASDTESVCSDSNSSSKDDGNVPQGRYRGARGIVVPARVWQETNNRIKVPVSPLCRSNSLKTETVLQSPRGNLLSRGLSPLRGVGLRPAMPGRMLGSASPSRSMASPTRARNASCSGPSVLCFTADVRRGKVTDSRISDAHLLRMMHNRHLQWRFVNSRAEAAMSLQRHIAETSLYNAWQATSDLRLSVCNRRLELGRLRLKLKLLSILKGQMMYLEEWDLMEKDHSNSLLGSTESLKASTLRLPIVCGAMADAQNLKDAMCTAFDVLHAMASSICSLMSKVEQMNLLFDEVVSTSTNELAMIDECRDVLSAVTAFQVKDCSLRAHKLQLKQVEVSGFSVDT